MNFQHLFIYISWHVIIDLLHPGADKVCHMQRMTHEVPKAPVTASRCGSQFENPTKLFV
jgi:hypothetical protein